MNNRDFDPSEFHEHESGKHETYEHYERDYTNARTINVPKCLSDEPIQSGEQLFDCILFYGCVYEKNFRRKAIPKMVDFEQKAAYEALAARFDEFAYVHLGKILTEVDYKNAEARIIMCVPFFECSSDTDRQLFTDAGNAKAILDIVSVGLYKRTAGAIANKDDAAFVEEIDDSWVCVSARFKYFQDLASSDDVPPIFDALLSKDENYQEIHNLSFEREVEFIGKLKSLVEILHDHGYLALRESPMFREVMEVVPPEKTEQIMQYIDRKIKETE